MTTLMAQKEKKNGSAFWLRVLKNNRLVRFKKSRTWETFYHTAAN